MAPLGHADAAYRIVIGARGAPDIIAKQVLMLVALVCNWCLQPSLAADPTQRIKSNCMSYGRNVHAVSTTESRDLIGLPRVCAHGWQSTMVSELTVIGLLAARQPAICSQCHLALVRQQYRAETNHNDRSHYLCCQAQKLV